VAQTIVVCRLRTVLELGRPRRTMACPTVNLGVDLMIVGTGVDLAEVPRIRAAIERYGRRFVERIYTPAEIAYVERKANRYERFAARFAAKEAGMKAIGTGWRRGVRWQDFEVANLPSGKPTLRFHGQAARFAEALGVKSVALSLTHTAELGMAHVILES
jgi:holo-[acyl-carrier protein] synthase